MAEEGAALEAAVSVPVWRGVPSCRVCLRRVLPLRGEGLRCSLGVALLLPEPELLAAIEMRAPIAFKGMEKVSIGASLCPRGIGLSTGFSASIQENYFITGDIKIGKTFDFKSVLTYRFGSASNKPVPSISLSISPFRQNSPCSLSFQYEF